MDASLRELIPFHVVSMTDARTGEPLSMGAVLARKVKVLKDRVIDGTMSPSHAEAILRRMPQPGSHRTVKVVKAEPASFPLFEATDGASVEKMLSRAAERGDESFVLKYAKPVEKVEKSAERPSATERPEVHKRTVPVLTNLGAGVLAPDSWLRR